MTRGLFFKGVCLFRARGYPISLVPGLWFQVLSGEEVSQTLVPGPFSSLWFQVPSPASDPRFFLERGTPVHWFLFSHSMSFWGGYSGLWSQVPSPASFQVLSWRYASLCSEVLSGGKRVPQSGARTGLPSSLWLRLGYPTSQGLGYPTPHQVFAAGDKPLRVSRRRTSQNCTSVLIHICYCIVRIHFELMMQFIGESKGARDFPVLIFFSIMQFSGKSWSKNSLVHLP